MHKLVELSEKVEKEVGKIANKPELSLVDIEAACKAVKLMKEIEEVLSYRADSTMEEDMYGRSYYRSMPRHYGTSRNNMNHYKGINYGHNNEHNAMIDRLESMMASSNNEQYREIIAEAVDKMNRVGN